MSDKDQNMSTPDERGSDEPTLIMNRSEDAASTFAQEPTAPSRQAGEGPSEPDRSISNQDTVVSPRLRQLAHTPSEPLRKPSEADQPAGDSMPWMRWLIIGIAGLVALALILVGVLALRRGPELLSSLSATKTPTSTSTRRPTATLPPTATHPPATPTLPPTPVLPSPTPRPAPTALAANVLAKVTPPEGLKLKVRDKASTAGAVLGELDKDAQVGILEGPTEANGIRWWKVDNGKGLIGWSAEGVGGVKYLAPVGWFK